VENRREGSKVRQKSLGYFSSLSKAREYASKHGIRFAAGAKDDLSPALAARLEAKLAKLNSLRPLAPQVLERMREKFEVDMTYNSNAIEGNRLSLRETWLVLRKGMTIRGKSLSEHLEATNHAEAIGLLEKIVSGGKAVTETDVLELHAAILDKIDESNAGFYRHEQVYIAGATHVPPAWKQVPELMAGVYSELNGKAKGIGAIVSAVKVHYETVRVHPFVDGNGRLARLLMNLRLMRTGFPPTILRKQERKAYYSALEKADAGDLQPLAMLIAKDVERALDLYLQAAEN